MPFRFHKTIKIAPGVKFNFNKKSASMSFGGKHAGFTISPSTGAHIRASAYGTGLSYNRNGNHGLFYVNYNSVSNANANIGCRVLLGLATHLHSSSSQAAERAPRPTGQGLLSPLLLLFLANPLMLGFARMGRGEGVIFLGTPWCRLANRTRFSTLPQPAGAVERS